MNESVWEVQSHSTVLGSISLVEIDQPFFRCNFQPSDFWNEFRPLFDNLARVVDRGIENEVSYALKVVHDLDISLIPSGGGESIHPTVIQVRGTKATFRY